MLFFTSDQHFFHRNILEKTSRGDRFGDVEAMNEHFVHRWNATVGDGDFVWVLGDFDMGGKQSALELVSRLNGRKGLVVGNHDGCFAGLRKSTDTLVRRTRDYVVAGFDVVTPFAFVGVQAAKNAPSVWFNLSHFPYDGDGFDADRGENKPDRFGQFRLRDEGVPLLHGHTHRPDQRVHVSDAGTFQLHVGVDAWDYTPVSATTVVDLYGGSPPGRVVSR